MTTMNLYCSWKRETVNDLPARLDAAMIDRNGRRYYLTVSSYERTIYRTTNKRTGAPLKKAVVDKVIPDALHIDTTIKAAEYWGLEYDWRGCKRYSGYDYDGSSRDVETEKLVYSNCLTYTAENILKIINYITGGGYESINVAYSETAKPAEWEAIQARETAAARWDAIEAETNKLSAFIDTYLQRGKNISISTLEKMRALESFTGTTAADVDRIGKLVKRSGGWYEKNIMSSSARLILKESADCFKVYNLAQNTFFRVKNNIITA